MHKKQKSSVPNTKKHPLFQNITFYVDLLLQSNIIVENFQCVIVCIHKRCCCTTLIQKRGCRRYTCTQYTTSSKQRTCRTTLFSNTFIVCTQKVLLYNIDNIDPHRGGYTYIHIYSVYNKQQTATGNFLAKKGAIRPSARCHFATNYQLLCQYLFLHYNF